MRLAELTQLIRSDLYRYDGATGWAAGFYHWRRTPGFRYSFGLRLCAYLKTHPLFRLGVYHLASWRLERLTIRYGISIPVSTRIGHGLYIGHFGGIFIHGDVVIGRNCNLSQGVTIGQTNRGPKQGTPVIGDHVYIGPGAKVIGGIRVGSHAAIGANCVVTHDVPEKGVVVGVPGRVVSTDGSAGYVEFTDY